MCRRQQIDLVALIHILLLFVAPSSFAASSWNGAVIDDTGRPVAGAVVKVHGKRGGPEYAVSTLSDGKFVIQRMEAGSYEVTVRSAEKEWKAAVPLVIKDAGLDVFLQIVASGEVLFKTSAQVAEMRLQASGGEQLSSSEVSSLPRNARDFSKLLLLAAGTMTDANGAANFTQQFAVNGQRGVTTIFAMEGFDTTDPEMGGATFSNFNVDAIQEVESNSGVLPAEVGHGAASYTNVISKSGVNGIHGSVFEFLRNASLDARNYFDHTDPSGHRRIPPFQRNEFGFTNGGPIVLPGIYNGRDRTFYFGEYQGFRQVLGTTQVIPVPTAAERKGIDTSTFPGDTLMVPVSAAILPVLNGYPLPNEPEGPFGNRTYATSSKVVTRTDQFSIRVDHKISAKSSLIARFSLNQV